MENHYGAAIRILTDSLNAVNTAIAEFERIAASKPSEILIQMQRRECKMARLHVVRRYRLTGPTLALFREHGRLGVRTIPAQAVITVDSAAFDGDELQYATWRGESVMIFAQDLRCRTEPVRRSATRTG